MKALGVADVRRKVLVLLCTLIGIGSADANATPAVGLSGRISLTTVGTATAGAVLPGENSIDNTGIAVSSAGDVPSNSERARASATVGPAPSLPVVIVEAGSLLAPPPPASLVSLQAVRAMQIISRAARAGVILCALMRDIVGFYMLPRQPSGLTICTVPTASRRSQRPTCRCRSCWPRMSRQPPPGLSAACCTGACPPAKH